MTVFSLMKYQGTYRPKLAHIIIKELLADACSALRADTLLSVHHKVISKDWRGILCKDALLRSTVSLGNKPGCSLSCHLIPQHCQSKIQSCRSSCHSFTEKTQNCMTRLEMSACWKIVKGEFADQICCRLQMQNEMNQGVEFMYSIRPCIVHSIQKSPDSMNICPLGAISGIGMTSLSSDWKFVRGIALVFDLGSMGHSQKKLFIDTMPELLRTSVGIFSHLGQFLLMHFQGAAILPGRPHT